MNSFRAAGQGWERGARSQGFTLVELMVAVGVVAILATLAIPSYTQYVRREKLSEGTAALAAMQVRMESFYQNNGNYGATACGITAGNYANFTLACALDTTAGAAAGQSYRFTATATAPGIFGTAFLVDEQGNKSTTVTTYKTVSASGSTSLVATGTTTYACWRVSGGEC